ncbi:hypothetical protein LTR95_017440, partial [Oleoguttula sp. CCFEE 5521]
MLARHRNNYWRITNYNDWQHGRIISLTQERRIKLVESLGHSQLADRHRRFDCGYLTYDNCKLIELNGFLQERGIAQNPSPNRKRAIRKLHAADDNATFRLLDLPTELQIQVCEHYCMSFGDAPLYAPRQPPLAFVSHQMRQMVLPIFYSQCAFQLNVSWPRTGCRLNYELEEFFCGMKPADLAAPKEINICMSSENDSRDDPSDLTMLIIPVEIQLAQNGTSYKLDVNGDMHYEPYVGIQLKEDPGTFKKRSRMVQGMIEDKLRRVLDHIIRRQEGRAKLCFYDILHLARAFGSAWKGKI